MEELEKKVNKNFGKKITEILLCTALLLYSSGCVSSNNNTNIPIRYSYYSDARNIMHKISREINGRPIMYLDDENKICMSSKDCYKISNGVDPWTYSQICKIIDGLTNHDGRVTKDEAEYVYGLLNVQ